MGKRRDSQFAAGADFCQFGGNPVLMLAMIVHRPKRPLAGRVSGRPAGVARA
jgi:hypothetical protein